MPGLIIFRRAQKDIDEIWDYTFERWELQQADEYTNAIKTAIKKIANNPKIGRPCPDIRVGYSKYAVKSHFIFYRHTSNLTEIIRILHQSRDIIRHLH